MNINFLSVLNFHSYQKVSVFLHFTSIILIFVIAIFKCEFALSKSNTFSSIPLNTETYVTNSKERFNGLDLKKMKESSKQIDKLSRIKADNNPPIGIGNSAQMMLDLAYLDFKNKRYEISLSRINYFLKFYKHHEQIDHALYMKGFLILNLHKKKNSIFLINPDLSKRDNESIQQAYKIFSRLIELFPKSKYAADAKKQLVLLSNCIAMKEMHIANHYYQMGAYIAAIKRTKAIIDNFEGTSAAIAASKILLKSYEALNLSSC